MALQDGERKIVMDANGNVNGLPASAGDLIDPLKKSLQSLHLQIPTIAAELRPPQGKLLGSSNDSSFAPIHPYGAVVLSDTPEFNWRPLPNAKSYRIAIYDSKYQEVLRSDRTNWTFMDRFDTSYAREDLFMAGNSNVKRKGDLSSRATRTRS